MLAPRGGEDIGGRLWIKCDLEPLAFTDTVGSSSTSPHVPETHVDGVWVLEPSSFTPTLRCSAGETGIWGLSGAAAVASELARTEDITTRAVVRVGDVETVLEEERQAVAAERVFTRADVAVGAGVYLGRSRAARLESDAA